MKNVVCTTKCGNGVTVELFIDDEPNYRIEFNANVERPYRIILIFEKVRKWKGFFGGSYSTTEKYEECLFNVKDLENIEGKVRKAVYEMIKYPRIVDYGDSVD